MNRTRRYFLAALLAAAALLPPFASAQTAVPGPCIPGERPSHARSLICVPAAGWNGQLVVFAHGYVDVDQPANPATIANTTINMLRYNVRGTNDAVEQLGGNPFGNRLRLYVGSSNDFRLNLLVQRFTASPVARAALAQYETNGNLRIPLVTLHTTADEVIPFWHELLYLPKVDLSDRGRFLPIPAFRYGHCNFTPTEVLTAFGLAVQQP